MSFNDPISECITKIRNANQAKHRYVDLVISNAKMQIVKILKEQGFIGNFLIDKNKRKLRVFLKYSSRKSILNGLKRISKPGLRKYVKSTAIPRVLNGMGITILSTSKGVIDGETARKEKVGGEVWCYVW